MLRGSSSGVKHFCNAVDDDDNDDDERIIFRIYYNFDHSHKIVF